MQQLIKLIKSMVSELLIILFILQILKLILKPTHIIMFIIRLHLNQSINLTLLQELQLPNELIEVVLLII